MKRIQSKLKGRQETKMDRKAAHARLTEKAMKSPGVADIVRIYDQLAKIENAHNTFLGAIAPTQTLGSADSVSRR